jgi:hypothetical protein
MRGSFTLAALTIVTVVAGCGRKSATPGVPSAEHDHELHLPPVGPSVTVTIDGRSVDVALASAPHEGTSLPLAQLWKAAWPAEDPAPLHFDLVGSDGFHPTSRPKCTRLLTGAEIAAGRIDVFSHDVSFDDALNLPGCYRVKSLVRIDASR